MKFLWLTSFRPLGKSKINDLFQSTFVDSVQSLNLDITFSLTQFEEENVEKFIKNKNIKCYLNNLSKSILPANKKYSNKIMLDHALDQYIENGNFEYLVYSTADIIVPSNFAKSLKNIKEENICSFIWPNIHIVNGNVKNTFWPHYGIDLIIFKLSVNKAIKFKQIIKSYNQYDWGVNENFYLAACDALNLKRNNLYKYSKVLKFDNDFKAFTEDRSWQIKTWNENQKYFLNFLKENKLSKLYAYGSYFYLLYKAFNFKDLNFNLFIAYIIYYPYYFILKIFNIFLINFIKKN
jgi:hypothetical protein